MVLLWFETRVADPGENSSESDPKKRTVSLIRTCIQIKIEKNITNITSYYYFFIPNPGNQINTRCDISSLSAYGSDDNPPDLDPQHSCPSFFA